MPFPSPDSNSTHTIGERTWVWDGSKWNLTTVVNEFADSDAIVPTVTGAEVTHDLVYTNLEELLP